MKDMLKCFLLVFIFFLMVIAIALLMRWVQLGPAFNKGYEKGQTEISKQDSALYKVAYHEGWIDALNAEDTTIVYIDSLFTHEYFYIELTKHH